MNNILDTGVIPADLKAGIITARRPLHTGAISSRTAATGNTGKTHTSLATQSTDDYWKGIARKRHVGKISTPMILVDHTSGGRAPPRGHRGPNPPPNRMDQDTQPRQDTSTHSRQPTTGTQNMGGPGPPTGQHAQLHGGGHRRPHPETLPVATTLLWPRAMGAMGIFPPTYPTILASCGATPKAARRAIKAAAAALAATAHLLWRQRCTEVKREEKQNPHLTHTTRQHSRAEYTAACEQRGEPGPPTSQQPPAALRTLRAAVEARRRGIDDPDDPPMAPEHDAAGKMTAKFCPKCEQEAKPKARVCPEDSCRHPLPPMRSYPKQGPQATQKPGLRRGEADRPDSLVINKAWREHEGETYDPSDTEEYDSDDTDDTDEPTEPTPPGTPKADPKDAEEDDNIDTTDEDEDTYTNHTSPSTTSPSATRYRWPTIPRDNHEVWFAAATAHGLV
eukprot:CAMPEP_0182860732 /NCGR_PEP_ID=MMETSP0034_2-20130328/5095_1 /TAXON_ID=156128 /ORGANISM="Nephroselmis pyriformis, Strain CCMP717" /LENGTH=448 /DNA_ID=CAMNT_0024992577 /DNA_START=1040 /DNA_END=2387 /DNA_ORIENTATION=+